MNSVLNYADLLALWQKDVRSLKLLRVIFSFVQNDFKVRLDFNV